MKRLFFLFIFLCTAFALKAQKANVSGTVFDSETGKAIPGVSVEMENISTITNNDGTFKLVNVPVGNDSISITMQGYEKQILWVTITAPETKLGEFGIKPAQFYTAENAGISEVNLSSLDFEDENKGQNITGLLHSTSDVFANTAGYAFGAAYFRPRGYDSQSDNVYMSGILMNDPETGRPSWAEWGGLNDAMRNKEVVNGLEAARFSFGDVGGATNILTRASMQRKQNKLSYSFSDRSYTHSIAYTYSTGLMKNNWAFTVSGSRRFANEGYVAGTFYDAWAYFASAEKKLNDKHSLAFTVYGSPTKRGMQTAATQECYELTGSHYYNPNWGYQDGLKRNARVRSVHEPTAIMNDYWKVNNKINFTNSLGYSYERYGTTGLDWNNAPDPRPDYYRYLPSWQTNQNLSIAPDPTVVAEITNQWKTDLSVSQINWDKLYQINRLANSTNSPSNYMLEEMRNDHSQISLNSVMNYQKDDHTMITGGLELSKYTGYHFNTAKDMLGGNYWVDIDQYAEQDYHGNLDSMQNDLNNPNRVIKQGDIFGYHYNTYQNSGLLWGQVEKKYNKVEFFGAANVSNTEFWREGLMRNGRAPQNSFGNSAKSDYTNFGIKGGFTYKINGHNYVIGNIGYITTAPTLQNAFVLPDIKNTLVPGLGSETVFSGDISYIYKTPFINAKLSAYRSQFTNNARVISFYDDDYSTFVNMSMTGIDQTTQGVELGAEVKASSAISFVLVGAAGDYRYTSEPTATISFENGEQADKTETIYQKKFYISGTPQNVVSLGVKYSAPGMWTFNANVNYFDKMYLDFDPERRTESAIAMLGPGDPMINEITQQQKLKDGGTIDASVGKWLSFKKYFFTINFSVSNILDNQNLISNGYEQMRFDFAGKNFDKFPPKYFYCYGRTFYLSVSVRI